jgi:hypothetical protein
MPRQLAHMWGKEKGQLGKKGGGDAAGIVLVSAAAAPAASRATVQQRTQDMERDDTNLSQQHHSDRCRALPSRASAWPAA